MLVVGPDEWRERLASNTGSCVMLAEYLTGDTVQCDRDARTGAVLAAIG